MALNRHMDFVQSVNSVKLESISEIIEADIGQQIRDEQFKSLQNQSNSGICRLY